MPCKLEYRELDLAPGPSPYLLRLGPVSCGAHIDCVAYGGLHIVLFFAVSSARAAVIIDDLCCLFILIDLTRSQITLALIAKQQFTLIAHSVCSLQKVPNIRYIVCSAFSTNSHFCRVSPGHLCGVSSGHDCLLI